MSDLAQGRMMTIVPQDNGWTEIAVSTKGKDGVWFTKSIRLSPKEWADVQDKSNIEQDDRISLLEGFVRGLQSRISVLETTGGRK